MKHILLLVVNEYCTMIPQIFNCNIAGQMGCIEREFIEGNSNIFPLQNVILSTSCANFLLFPAAFQAEERNSFHTSAPMRTFTSPLPTPHVGRPPWLAQLLNYASAILREPLQQQQQQQLVQNFCPRKTQLKLNFLLSLLPSLLPPPRAARLAST